MCRVTRARSATAIAVAVALVTACGSSADDTSAQTPATPPPTAASTTAATTTTPTTTAPAPTTAAPVASATSACLQGQWLMDDLSTTALHQTLLPGFPVVVSGSQQFTFDGETVEYYINEVLRFSVPGVDVSTAFNTRSAGSFDVDSEPSLGDTISMDYLTVEGGFGPIEGTALDNENNPLSVLVETPGFEMPAIGGGPISCDGDVMTILVTSGIANELATFTRIG